MTTRARAAGGSDAPHPLLHPGERSARLVSLRMSSGSEVVGLCALRARRLPAHVRPGQHCFLFEHVQEGRAAVTAAGTAPTEKRSWLSSNSAVQRSSCASLKETRSRYGPLLAPDSRAAGACSRARVSSSAWLSAMRESPSRVASKSELVPCPSVTARTVYYSRAGSSVRSRFPPRPGGWVRLERRGQRTTRSRSASASRCGHFGGSTSSCRESAGLGNAGCSVWHVRRRGCRGLTPRLARPRTGIRDLRTRCAAQVQQSFRAPLEALHAIHALASGAGRTWIRRSSSSLLAKLLERYRELGGPGAVRCGGRRGSRRLRTSA